MTLYFIGLGLGDEKDITVKGLEAVKSAHQVYLETYTSFLTSATKKDLEKFYGKKIIAADRNLVENDAEKTILKDARKQNVAFLVVGDPLSATTHLDLKMRADELNIPVKIIGNTSIMTAVGTVGLELYKFGRTTTIPFDNKNVTSPYEVMRNNLNNNLHTLVLLDLDPENEKFMTFNEGIQYLMQQGMNKNQPGIGCCQISSKKPIITVGKVKEIVKKKYAKFPQCLIIPSKLHFMEEDALRQWK